VEYVRVSVPRKGLAVIISVYSALALIPPSHAIRVPMSFIERISNNPNVMII
jgi:hypothetical protein